MHNLSKVYKFEVIRTLKKKTFWIMALLFPLAMGAVFGIIYLSNQTTADEADRMKEETFSLAVTDQSGTINPAALQSLNPDIISDKQQGIAAVMDKKVDAYFYFPKNLATEKIEVYGQDVGLFDNSKYEAVAKFILEQSATATVDPNIAVILAAKTTVSTTTYREGAVYDPISQAIAPGIFLVLFYFLIAMFGNQMLTSTTEEKENRVIEIILTTVSARTLIIGKVLSLITLAIIQTLILLTPVIIAYFALKDTVGLPAIDLNNISFNWYRVLAGFALFAASFMLFTGLLVMVGAASPTAKEAGSYLSVVFILLFMPLYAVSLFVSSPDTPIVTFLTFFPLTAPIPAMLRNAVGNLSPTDTLLVIAILTVSATAVVSLAIQVFKTGAIEYSKALLPAFLKKLRRS